MPFHSKILELITCRLTVSVGYSPDCVDSHCISYGCIEGFSIKFYSNQKHPVVCLVLV